MTIDEGQAQLPAEAFRFSGRCEFGDNGEGSRSIPVRLVARSPDPIEHWYWGAIVHRLEGAFLRDGQPILESQARINLDFAHGSAATDIIGYANRFEITDEGLILHGAITPQPEGFQGEDTAQRVVNLARAGVPLEASINFAGSGVKLRVLEEAEELEVNGRLVSGPAYVVQEWPLRNCAICSLGADGATQSQVLSDQPDLVTVSLEQTEEPDMATKQDESHDLVNFDLDDLSRGGKPVQDTSEPAEPQAELATGVDAPAADHDSAEARPDQPAVDAQRLADAPRFLEIFGEFRGALLFEEGLTLEDALIRTIRDQAKQINELNQQVEVLTNAAAGHGEALSHTEGDVKPTEPLITGVDRL